MHPIQAKLQGVFVPVSNIEQARDWYCKLLNLPNDGEIYFGHIYVLPLQSGVDLVLDSKIYTPENVFKVPAVQLATVQIEQAFQYAQVHGIEIITEIQHNQWFNIKDPDGNVLMICQSQ